MISSVVYLATNNSALALYDTSGNLLDAYTVEPGVRIKSIAVPTSADDLTLAVLTETDTVYQLKLSIVDLSDDESGQARKKPSQYQELKFLPGSETRINLREKDLG